MMVEKKKKEYKTRRHVDVFTDDLEWFDKEYPNLPLSSMLCMMLRNFRRIHMDVGLTPNRAARDSAKELKDEIDEGLLER